jgi:serine/threonine protein kinase
MVAKVGDFGLSKLISIEGASHVSTMAKGTAGYIDPEYNNTQQLTNKSDIFSLGIILLELLCGRPPIDRSLPDRTQWNIGEWVKKTYS